MLEGEFYSNNHVLGQEIILPEFKCTPNIDKQACQGCTGPYMHDDILGCDFLLKMHSHINFNINTMSCMEIPIPKCSPDFFTDNTCI